VSNTATARRISRPVLLSALALSFAFAATGWGAAPAAEEKPRTATASWQILDAVATIHLDTATLSALGYDVTELQPSVSGHAPHALSVAPAGSPSFAFDRRISLTAAVGVDGFHTFEEGSLHSRGGFRLHGRGERGEIADVDLSSFELRAGTKAGGLEILDTQGVPLLATGAAQWEFDAAHGKLRYLNADLRILPELARRLGEERYADTSVGIFALDLTLAVGPVPPAPQVDGPDAPPPCGDWTGTVDVGLTNMSIIGQAGIATVNGRSVVVVLPSADLRNVGTANVPWFSKFTNLGVAPWNDQHPFLVWQMLRSVDGVLEPIGKSDLKHAFLTLNTGCSPGACTDSHVLGIGCSDVYDTGTNNSVGSLAPRSEVTASTGIWNHCNGVASHFDTNGDCSADFSGSGENSFTHGLKAAESDLRIAGASYYVEAFYIVRNDSNIFNSMGYRQVTPTKPGSVWSFPTVGAYAQGPVINAWVNPASPGVNADNRTLDTGEGHLQLAVRVADVAGSPGRKRFAYAFQNHDFDRQIQSFHVPFNATGANVTNAAYADGDAFTANDWTVTTDSTGITWTAPTGTTPPAPIDYATLVSFRFEADAGGVETADAGLGVFEAGSPTALTIQTLAPAAATGPVSAGSFYSVAPCRLMDTRNANGASGGPALNPNQERSFPVTGQCGIPSTAKAVALNVTAITPGSDGYAVVYAGAPPSISSINYSTGRVRANNMIVGLAADGTLKIQAVQPIGQLNVAVDVSGYFE
jgi:hypothetical protein